MADVFSKNGYTVLNKIAKILKIFDELEGLKSQGWYFTTKKLDQLFYLCIFDGWTNGLAIHLAIKYA